MQGSDGVPLQSGSWRRIYDGRVSSQCCLPLVVELEGLRRDRLSPGEGTYVFKIERESEDPLLSSIVCVFFYKKKASLVKTGFL